jgi:hypothetical protein
VGAPSYIPPDLLPKPKVTPQWRWNWRQEMAAKTAVKRTGDQEVWEITIPGTVYVMVRDPRTPGLWKDKKVSGRKNKRLSITKDEREYNQQEILEDNAHLDPFTNGVLICRQGELADTTQVDDEMLKQILAFGDEAFRDAYLEMDNEFTLRRLLIFAEKTSTNIRFLELKDHIDLKYRVGGTQKTVREMEATAANERGSVLS